MYCPSNPHPHPFSGRFSWLLISVFLQFFTFFIHLAFLSPKTIPISPHNPVSLGKVPLFNCVGVFSSSTFCSGWYLRRQHQNWSLTSQMSTVMKGIYKGFKYTLSQFFVVKECEIEIGYPTDVKHVAHIGWDGASGTAPSWMSEFQTGPDFTATSIGNSVSGLSPWSSQEFGESMRQPLGSEMFRDLEFPPLKKKQKRKKSKSYSGSSSRSASAAAKSNAKFVEGPTKIEVA